MAFAGGFRPSGAHLQEALRRSVDEFGDESEEAAETRNNLAVLYKFSGRFAAAHQLYERSLRTMSRVCGPVSLPVAVILHNIGGVLHAEGNFTAAEEPGRRAWEVSRQILGDDDPTAMFDAAAYAAILDGLGRYERERADSRACSRLHDPDLWAGALRGCRRAA